MSDDLPLGWALVTPDQIAADASNALTIGPFGSDLKVSDYRTNGVPLVFVREIRASLFGDEKTKCVDQVKATQLARHKVRAGDLLITKMGDPPGDTAVYPNTRPDAIITADCIKLTPNTLVTSAAYLNLCFKAESVRAEILENTAGVAQQKLSLERFRTVRLPLPPLNEQRRIVAKLEDLFARSRRAKDALDAIPPLLEKLRQSILAAAFRGDLTADWRAKNPDVEPAEELLKRIRIERRKKWEEAELAKLRAKGKAPADDRWKAKYKEPEPVDASELPELPEGWCWGALESFCEVVDPQPSHRTPPEVNGGIPYVGMGDILDNGSIELESARLVDLSVLAEHRERYTLEVGDFVFGKIGTLGAPALLTPPFDYALSANLILVQPRDSEVCRAWPFHFLQSPQVTLTLESESRATSQAAFGIQRLRTLAIAIAPVREQLVLLPRLKRALAGVSGVGRVVLGAASCSQALERAALAKAFRGELVDQDPSDEPASVMLERLAAERQAAQESPAASRRSRRNKARA